MCVLGLGQKLSNIITRDALNWKPEGKRPLRTARRQDGFTDFRTLGIDSPEEIANDREKWIQPCRAEVVIIMANETEKEERRKVSQNYGLDAFRLG